MPETTPTAALTSARAQALLAAVRNAPDDTDAWLVLADWLTEHGDARGQLIVWEQQLPRGAPFSEERAALQQQVDALVSAHQGAWLSGLDVPKGARLEWQHGLVVGVKLWLWNAGTLGFVASLAAHPCGALLRALSLGSNGIGAEGAASLAASPYLSGLKTLRLYDNAIGDEGAASLASSPHLAGLESLDLDYNGIGAAGAAALASSPHLAALTELHLSSNDISAEGAASLASSPHLAALKALYLSSNGIGAAGAAALASSPHLAALTELHLSNNGIGAEGASALASSETLRSCEIHTDTRSGGEGLPQSSRWLRWYRRIFGS